MRFSVPRLVYGIRLSLLCDHEMTRLGVLVLINKLQIVTVSTHDTDGEPQFSRNNCSSKKIFLSCSEDDLKSTIELAFKPML